MLCPKCNTKLNDGVTVCINCKCFLGECPYCKTATFFFEGETEEEQRSFDASEELFVRTRSVFKNRFMKRMGAGFGKLIRGEIEVGSGYNRRCGACEEEVNICHNCNASMLLTQTTCNYCGVSCTLGISTVFSALKKIDK